MNQGVSGYNGHEFIVFLSIIEGQKEIDSTYTAKYRGYDHPSAFVHDLDKGLNDFRCSLTTLSLHYPKENRRVYLINLFEFLDCIAENLRDYHNGLNEEFPFECRVGNISVMQDFPPQFSEEHHPTPIDYHNHKMHYMVQYHYEVLMETMDVLMRYAASENITLNREHKRIGKGLSGNEDPEDDFLVTKLSSAQLSLLTFLLSEEILEPGYNKMHLAKFLARHFKTVRRSNLRPFQMYKAFYEQDEHNYEVVKEIVFRIYQRLKNPKRD